MGCGGSKEEEPTAAVPAPVFEDASQVQLQVHERAEPLRPVAIDLGNVVGLEFDMCARHTHPATVHRQLRPIVAVSSPS